MKVTAQSDVKLGVKVMKVEAMCSDGPMTRPSCKYEVLPSPGEDLKNAVGTCY